jgi:hypothetical protein
VAVHRHIRVELSKIRLSVIYWLEWWNGEGELKALKGKKTRTLNGHNRSTGYTTASFRQVIFDCKLPNMYSTTREYQDHMT